jgi:8-oxo-dGTP pyrophosphatase MutT (NUDIX family)
MMSLEQLTGVLRHSTPHRIPENPELVRAAVVLLFRGTAEGVDLLFIRRSEQANDPWSGHMAFPGGRVDPSDTDSRFAARRELREELAIALEDCAHELGVLSHLRAMARGRVLNMVIEPFVYALHQEVTLIPAPEEVAEAIWIPLSFFLDPRHRESMQVEFAGESWTLPCYRREGRTIWGLTLRMLDELLMALQHAPHT